MKKNQVLTALCLGAFFIRYGSLASADYAVMPVLGGLNQPTFVTQAPGDNVDLFITERKSLDGSLGDIIQYNRLTGAKSTFLDINGPVAQDGGVLGLAFSPDFQTNHRFYVSSFVQSTDRLDEYQVINGTPTLQRTLLQYDNPATQHTIGWIGFQPNAVGNARNNLYVSAGDGGIQADQPGFINRGQDPTTQFGKVLRLDVNPLSADAYPNDPAKNFAIPADNPFVADNTGKLKEVFLTGFRNPWRASFDRQTGDLYLGDVGLNTKEEIDFVRNDASFTSGADYGWAKREGTITTPVAGVGGSQGSSINPIYEVAQPAFESITGGYVYRGPIAELSGQYIFGDFKNSQVRSLTFDRNTDPSTFNGISSGISNATDLTATLNAKIVSAGGTPMTLIVSFGEDNAGNLLIVGFSNAAAGGAWYDPPLGTGEIFMIAPKPADADTDGVVGIRDLYALASHWNQPGDYASGDFNFDGVVNVADLTILASHWQDGAAGASLGDLLASLGLPQVQVPEPGVSLLAMAMLSLSRCASRRVKR